MITPELQSKIAMWRAKANAGTLPIEEMREAIVVLRAGRRAAESASTSSKRTSRAKIPTRSADDMLGDLESL